MLNFAALKKTWDRVKLKYIVDFLPSIMNEVRNHTGTLLLALSFLCAVGVVWVRTATVRDTYRYVQQEKAYKVYEQNISDLRLRWLKLTSPIQLQSIAKEKGLKAPQIHQVIPYTNEPTQE